MCDIITDLLQLAIILFNFLLMVLGCGMFVIGIMLRHFLDVFLSRAGSNVALDNKATTALNDWLDSAAKDESYSEVAATAGLILILLGFFLFAACTCGCLGLLLEHKTMVQVFIWCNVGLLVTEIAVLAILFSPKYQLVDRVKAEMLLKVKKVYTPAGTSPFSKLMNSAMDLSKCCGVNGPKDFEDAENMNFDMGEGTQQRLKVPPVCCNNSDKATKPKENLGVEGLDESLEEVQDLQAMTPAGYSAEVMECALKGGEGGLVPVAKGCFEDFVNSLSTAQKTAIIIVFSTIFIQIFQIVMSLYYIRNQ